MYLLPTILLSTLAAAQTGNSIYKKRLTGSDLDTSQRWGVAGTDLGIPYVLENGAIGYLFGDTWSTQWPGGENWRSPVLLRSTSHPRDANGIVFDSAASVAGDGLTPEITFNAHQGDDGTGTGTWEYTVIPNDGIGFNETGGQIVSYMSIRNWTSPWSTNYAGLARSADGNTFTRLETRWENDADNADPFQMWTMQRDGDWVYVFSVRAGRQPGPMMLRRVRWDRMGEMEAYEGWGWNGEDWAWGRPCSAILEGSFGEPSVRKLADGTWAMVYLRLEGAPAIVSRTARGPDQTWSEETVQVTWLQEESLYGGFIHPWSTAEEGGLHLMVSKWTRNEAGESTAYHVSQYQGSL